MNKLLTLMLFVVPVTGHAKCLDCSNNKNLEVYSESEVVKREVASKAYAVVMEAVKGERVILDSRCQKLMALEEDGLYTFSNGSKRSYIALDDKIIGDKKYVSSLCLKNKQKDITILSCVTRTKSAFENMDQDEQISFYIKYGKITKKEEGVVDALIECPTP